MLNKEDTPAIPMQNKLRRGVFLKKSRKMPRNSIEINNSEDYCAWASDVLSQTTESIIGDERYTRQVTEDDLEIVEDHWTHIFTKRGQDMVCNWHRRLVALGEVKFQEDEMEIENWNYSEG